MKINEIGKEMVKQSNRSTQFPLFIVVQDEKRYVGPDGDWTHRERLEENDEIDLCIECLNKYHDDEEMPDSCDDCAEDCFDYYYIEEKVPVMKAGCFFTAEACNEHIRNNDYHYTNPSSFAISAWRNPEMQSVMKHLVELSGEKVPSHYE